MNENQIIQALKICRKDEKCTVCPYYSVNSTTCMSQLASDALNLIQKQREEINELTGKHYNECGQIAKYSDELNQFADIGKMYSEIKSEAIKEFAEKLKDVFVTVDGTFECSEVEEHIDNLVKEMTGGET